MTDHAALRAKQMRSYYGMLGRCRPTSKCHTRYFDRGITVCDLWRKNRQAYFDHVGLPPSLEHQLDRIDNDRGYEPGNVRWATVKENIRNSTIVRMVTINGETKPLIDWHQQLGIGLKSGLFASRIKRGRTPEDALISPPRVNGHSLLAVAKANNIPRTTFNNRRNKLGWSDERAATEPIHNNGGKKCSQ